MTRTRRAAALGLAPLGGRAADAGLRLERMSWVEAGPVLKSGRVVLIPLGARLKEHGPHLPLNNDWLMAERLADRVIARAPVVAVPTVEYGYYPAFTEYPGSVSLSRETARDLVVELCRSLARHGAKRFYVLNTGISTVRSLEPARKVLQGEGLALEYTDLSEATDAVKKRVRRSEGGTHADEVETSMMLDLAPEVVRMDLAKKDYHEDRPGGLTRDPASKTGTYSPSGVWGDPTLAAAEKGRAVNDALVEHVLAALARMADPGYVPPPLKEARLN